MEREEVIALIKEFLLKEPAVRVVGLDWLLQADSACKWVTGNLTAADTAGGVFAAQTPDRNNFIVDLVVVDVTTASSGACTLDVGIAANATTLSDTLIDGVSLATTGLKNNYDDKGTNGRAVRKAVTGEYVTASVASGASSGLVGKYYIRYRSTI